MKIAIASDLHLEFSDITLQNTENADVLVLAGDILIAQDLHDHPRPEVPYSPEMIKILGSRQKKAQQYREFIEKCSKEFPHVVVIMGNHEAYHGKWIGSTQTLRDEYGQYFNVHFLECDTIVINGIRFVGCTLWTDLNRGDPITLHNINEIMNDYRVIRHDGLGYTKLRPAHTLKRHRESVEYIKSVLNENSDQPTVVVGHHAPTSLSVHEEYKNDRITNGAYYSDLSDIMLDNTQIKMWILGHMHMPHMYWMGETLVCCNPRGYENFDPDAESFRLRYIDLNNMPEKFDGVKWGRD